MTREYFKILDSKSYFSACNLATEFSKTSFLKMILLVTKSPSGPGSSVNCIVPAPKAPGTPKAAPGGPKM